MAKKLAQVEGELERAEERAETGETKAGGEHHMCPSMYSKANNI